MSMRTQRTRSGMPASTAASGVPIPRCATTGRSAAGPSSWVRTSATRGRSPPVTRNCTAGARAGCCRPQQPAGRGGDRGGDLIGLIPPAAGVALLRPAARGRAPMDVPRSDLALDRSRAHEGTHRIPRPPDEDDTEGGLGSPQRAQVGHVADESQPRRRVDDRHRSVSGGGLPAVRPVGSVEPVHDVLPVPVCEALEPALQSANRHVDSPWVSGHQPMPPGRRRAVPPAPGRRAGPGRAARRRPHEAPTRSWPPAPPPPAIPASRAPPAG